MVAVVLVALVAGLIVGGHYAWKAYQAHRAPRKSSAIVALPSSLQTQSPRASVAQTIEPPTASLAGRLDLQIAAQPESHVQVVADDKVVFASEVQSDRNRHFGATDRLEVAASDGSALLLNLNGRPVRPFAAPGSSGTIVLTKNDLRQATGGDTQRCSAGGFAAGTSQPRT